MTTPLHVACYNDLSAWVKKRRRALLVGAGVAGVGIGSYYLVKYYYATAAALEEEKQRRELAQLADLADKQRQEAEERAEAQLQNHFECVQRISDSTTLPSVMPHLKGRLFEAVDLSSLTEKLMAGKQAQPALTPAEKMQIWQDLKVLSFTRTFCAMWSVCLLDLFVRTQLNILGRRVYIETAQSAQPLNVSEDLWQEPRKHLTLPCQHKFIAFSDYLPHRGLDALIADCHRVVQVVVQSKQLKELHTLDQLMALFHEIRKAFKEQEVLWLRYVLPKENVLPDDLAAASSAADAARVGVEGAASPEDAGMLEQLLEETRRVVSSLEFVQVLSAAFDAVTQGVVEELRKTYSEDPSIGIHLAKLLPPIASVGSSLLDQPQENPYVQNLAALPDVKSFCAMVYADTIGGPGLLPPALIPH